MNPFELVTYWLETFFEMMLSFLKIVGLVALIIVIACVIAMFVAMSYMVIQMAIS